MPRRERRAAERAEAKRKAKAQREAATRAEKLGPLVSTQGAIDELHRFALSSDENAVRFLVYVRDTYNGVGLTYPIDTGCCETFQSPLHGTGVRATRKIDAGAVATVFPCDGILYKLPGVSGMIGRIIDPLKFTGDKWDTYEGAHEYTCDAQLPGYPWVGRVTSADAHIAHMINDGMDADTYAAIRALPSEYDADAAVDWAVRYGRQVVRNVNMALVHANGTVAACALRDIAEGEELTIAYGTKYWLMRAYPDIMGNGIPKDIAEAIADVLEGDEAINGRIELEDALNDKITAAATIKWG